MPKLSVSLTYSIYNTKRTDQKVLQFWNVVNSLKTWKTSIKESFDIQARGPQKREAPGICPVCPMVNRALATPWQVKGRREKEYIDRSNSFADSCNREEWKKIVYKGRNEKFQNEQRWGMHWKGWEPLI